MAKRIFEQIWGEQKGAVLRTCQLVETGLAMSQHQQKCGADAIQQKIDAAKKRKLVYSRMRADGELEKEEYKELCGELKKELTQLETQMQQVMQDEPVETNTTDMQRIRKVLE